MKRFFLISNPARDPGFELRGKAEDYLRRQNAVCIVRQRDSEKPPADTECVIVLGGDGTLLRVIREYADLSQRFIGINTGHVGYLTEGDASSLYQILDALLADKYISEQRMMLSGRVFRDGRYLTRHRALNDIVVSRTRSMKVIRLNVYVGGLFLCQYRADGLIVSSPTGSTAYSFSAGGPILEPTAQVIELTPISSHSLNNRSLILSAEDKITIEVPFPAEGDRDMNEYEAYYDGDKPVTLLPGDQVEVTRATTSVTLLKLSERSFVETLRIKISV